METQSRGVGCRTLFVVVMLALFVGLLGGGAAGGSIAYLMSSQQRAASPVVASAPAAGAAAQVVAVQPDSAIVQAVKRVNPAVVTIVATTQQRIPSASGPRNRQGQATGTGVVIDDKGYIVTNQHVIDGATAIQVLFQDGGKSDAKLIGSDAFSDLAVLQVTDRAMPGVAELGDSKALQQGEPVIAIGSALGDFRDTVTVGVVSGLNRQLSANEGSSLEGLIQTDAAINHGNSGGPLVNISGQVIGINSLVVSTDNNGQSAQGLGFAVPVNTVKYVAAQLLASGRVSRPFMGVTYTTLNPQIAAANNLAPKQGAWIQEISAGGPAARAGLKVGDVITAINGTALTADAPLPTILLKNKVGETVTLSVQRGDQTLNVDVKLADRPTTG
ncbi:MAG: trypsin-like peptidase domain-containing protein [Chloroflexi bacterium]|nr:trypsin-like peptidase domain-containing protein [Chloroflexota bacterium]